MVDERTLGSYDLEDAVIASWNPKTPWFFEQTRTIETFPGVHEKNIYII